MSRSSLAMQALKRGSNLIIVKEISNLGRGSKAWCRASSSFAASVPCDAPQVKKTGKWLPKGERRAMVESFVNRYRGENLGKFPTVSYAMKEVGGSYYVVKRIIQEMEYNSKNQPSPEISIPMKPEDVKEEEDYKFLLDIDGSKSKSEVHQPYSEVSCLENSKDVEEQSILKEISNLARGSKAWCRASSSFAASVPCDAPEVKKTGKRLPKGERRAMVESFVNRYRGENLGKFPTVSYAMKEVGGKYYVVKRIIQELEYNSKNQPSPEISIPMKPEDVKEEEDYKFLLDIDGSKSKSEVHQPYSEVSCLENSKDVEEQSIRGSVLEIDGSESKINKYQPSPEYLLLKKAENTREDEPNLSVPDINTSKTKGEVHQPLLDVSSEKKSEVIKENIICESVLYSGSSEHKAEDHKSSPEYSIPTKPEVTKEEETCQIVSGIDTSMTKGEVPQQLAEVSSAKKSEDVIEETRCESVLDVDCLKSKDEEHQSSPVYSIPTKTEVTKEEEPCQTVSNTDTSKTKGEIPQPLPEVSSAKKSEDAKEETRCQSVLDVDSSESQNEEHQPSPEHSVPKIPENTKGEKPYQVAADIDGSESIAEEHQKSARELSEKQVLEKIQIKSSIWGTLKSVAEDIINKWRKR